MTFVELILIALGLGLDAFAVAAAAGAQPRPLRPAPVLRMAVAFGFFQFFMPLMGGFAGRSMATGVRAADHWIALALLVVVGGRMAWNGLRSGGVVQPDADPTRGWTLLALAVATSIDALAVGLGLALVGTPVLGPASVIGLTAFLMTVVGMVLGRRLGRLFGQRVEIVGGLLLIAIGVRIVLEHTA